MEAFGARVVSAFVSSKSKEAIPLGMASLLAKKAYWAMEELARRLRGALVAEEM